MNISVNKYISKECAVCGLDHDLYCTVCHQCSRNLVLKINLENMRQDMEIYLEDLNEFKLNLSEKIAYMTKNFPSIGKYIELSAIVQILKTARKFLLSEFKRETEEILLLHPLYEERIESVFELISEKESEITKLIRKIRGFMIENPMQKLFHLYTSKYREYDVLLQKQKMANQKKKVTINKKEHNALNELSSEITDILASINKAQNTLCYKQDLLDDFRRFKEMNRDLPASKITAAMMRMEIEYKYVIVIFNSILYFDEKAMKKPYRAHNSILTEEVLQA